MITIDIDNWFYEIRQKARRTFEEFGEVTPLAILLVVHDGKPCDHIVIPTRLASEEDRGAMITAVRFLAQEQCALAVALVNEAWSVQVKKGSPEAELVERYNRSGKSYGDLPGRKEVVNVIGQRRGASKPTLWAAEITRIEGESKPRLAEFSDGRSDFTSGMALNLFPVTDVAGSAHGFETIKASDANRVWLN